MAEGTLKKELSFLGISIKSKPVLPCAGNVTFQNIARYISEKLHRKLEGNNG